MLYEMEHEAFENKCGVGKGFQIINNKVNTKVHLVQ
jgi:hypothetical protein